MKENEKKYLLAKCQKHYLRAMELSTKKPLTAYMELGKARGLKEVIEKFIDCQPSQYYEAYMLIVRLDKEFIELY